MRVVTYRSGRGERAGVLRDEGVVDAWDRLDAGHEPASVRALPEADRLDELADRLGEGQAHEGLPLDEVSLRPPVPDPDKIVCMGLNYRSHAEEQGAEPPDSPTFFAKFRNALVGTAEPVAPPASSEKIDYEAEVAFVIGREAKEVSADKGLDHVAGYTLLNDLSARDLQMGTPQWMPGKVFRRLRAVRACASHPRGGRHPRCDRVLADRERRAEAALIHRGPRLRRPRARRAPVAADDARARTLSRRALRRGGKPAQAPGVSEPGGRDLDRLADAGPVGHADYVSEILTVGHSTHGTDEFLDLLRRHEVEALADVRRFPSSRRLPHFNAGALRESMAGAGIEYVQLGDALGGRRKPRPDTPNTGWRVAGFRGYADHLATGEARSALAELERLGRDRRTAFMCAEGPWWRCHRQLIADALLARGWTVLHLMPDGRLERHRLTPFGVVEGRSVTYPQDSLDR